MNENTPLLNNNNSSSNGPSNANANANNYSADPEQLQQFQQDRHRRGVFMKPKSLTFTNKKKGEKKKTNSISKMPSLIPPVHKGPGGDYDEYDEAWMQGQREFIERAGIKPSLKKRIKFELDTSKKGRLWELFDVIISMIFVLLYIWVNFKFLDFYKFTKL